MICASAASVRSCPPPASSRTWGASSRSTTPSAPRGAASDGARAAAAPAPRARRCVWRQPAPSRVPCRRAPFPADSFRAHFRSAVRGEDNRLVVVTGPVSAHDPVAVMEYAKKLNALREQHSNELIIVMRVFLDEPAGGAGYWSGAMCAAPPHAHAAGAAGRRHLSAGRLAGWLVQGGGGQAGGREASSPHARSLGVPVCPRPPTPACPCSRCAQVRPHAGWDLPNQPGLPTGAPAAA